ncbi:MAG: hypothetical protein ACREN6_09480, partial [Gemmatimonadaceae bacterium]
MPAPSKPARHASRRRLAILGVACVAATLSCNRDVTGPNGGRLVHGLSWNSVFPRPLRDVGGLSAGVVDFNRVHVVLLHSDGTIALDSTISFASGTDSLTVSLSVRLLTDAPASGEPMELDLAYINAASDTVFKGGPIPIIAAPPPVSGGINPPVQIPVTYTGPGASATSVVIAPRIDSVGGAAPFSFTAVTKDAGGKVTSGTPVIWTSLDPTIATITAPAAGTGVALNVGGTARIVAQLLNGAADTVHVVVTVAGAATHTWTGATSNAWTTASNWSPASVPGSADSVFIPVAATLPTLSASTTVGAIVVDTGAPLTITTGATLTVNGAIDATGGIVGTGSVVLAGSKTATGFVSMPVTVTGSYTLSNIFDVAGTLAIQSGGIVLNGSVLAVSGDFSTSGTGTLTMTNSDDVVSITGNATFAGGSTVGRLTDGQLAVSGNFTQSGPASTFAPSGNHLFATVADAPQSVNVAAPGTAIFQNFVSANAQLVTITSPIVILGNAAIGGPVTTGANALTIDGALTDPAALLTTPALTLANTAFPLDPSTLAISSNVTFTGAGAALQGPLEVFGSVTVFGGNLRLNGEPMAVTGPFTTTTSGTLTMNNPADTLFVGGEATFAGGSEAGLLTDGTLGLRQGLVVGGAGQFSASGNHVTLLSGPVPVPSACLCSTAPVASRSATSAAAPAGTAAQKIAARRAKAAAARQTMPARRAALAAARQVLAAKWPSRALSARRAAVAGPAAVRAAKVAPVTISAAARARINANHAPMPTLRALPSMPSLRSLPARAGVSHAVVAPTAPRTGTALAASPARGTSFNIPGVSDSAVYVAFGDTTGNHFANVRVSGQTDWLTAANVIGKMLVDTTGDIEGNGHLLISDSMFVSGTGVVEPEAVELLSALSDSGFFSPDTTLFSAAGSQTMPSFAVGECPGPLSCEVAYENVIVKSPALGIVANDGFQVEVFGSLFIVSSGQLRIGVPDSVGCFGCESDELFVGGALETHGNGTLRMTDTNQPSISVDDSAYFAGGSTAGLLTQGESDFFGNFRQAGSAGAFAATSPH